VADGVIPKDKADDYVIVCGVFIHWDAADDTKIYQYNYDATKLAIKNAMAGTPKINDIIARKGEKHPFSPK
jgi:5,6,7,8-tetrahydromethanopterin hydro-lyase